MIVVGLIVAIAFGFAAGWGWRHLDPKRKELKGVFDQLVEKFALGSTSREHELLMYQTKLLQLQTQLHKAEAELLLAKIGQPMPDGRKPGTKAHLCHDARCQGFGVKNHFCHDGDCGRVPLPYNPKNPGRTNTCETCKAPPGIPCWEERHKKKRTSP